MQHVLPIFVALVKCATGYCPQMDFSPYPFTLGYNVRFIVKYNTSAAIAPPKKSVQEASNFRLLHNCYFMVVMRSISMQVVLEMYYVLCHGHISNKFFIFNFDCWAIIGTYVYFWLRRYKYDSIRSLW
ncbi:uncharacterized protein EV154DRAFT_477125 [Mucor mucedo]|uniref:uncharacterized protein n=1 Tax=Mucor mucedo TaxID=29922 RepID=UPI00222124A1|nr:uncharacterized protein EV154DRAFT_477125 [Mucor mucedo]KAI7895670.1 hypothetical protein EV154DRAFT_477125 [Mucor mucedo]